MALPLELENDREVAPFISRANELAGVNPIVSYYCLIHVLEHILANKLHTKLKEIERYTMELLDETEALKNSEELKEVLENKQLSATAVVLFAYKLFNQCVSDDGPNVVAKIRATINFLTVLKVFENNEGIDWEKLTGGKATLGAEFGDANAKRIKMLKVRLMRVLKAKDKEAEDELEVMLNDEKSVGEDEQPASEEGVPKFIDEPALPSTPSNAPALPSPPGSSPSTVEDDNDTPSLPGVPRNHPDAAESAPNLPLPPEYLPDEIPPAKSLAIHVIHRDEARPSSNRRPLFVPTEKLPAAPVTKETVQTIVDRTDAIAQIQKRAKFAISALNYEDIDTAETELETALQQLRQLKSV